MPEAPACSYRLTTGEIKLIAGWLPYHHFEIATSQSGLLRLPLS